ncbi:uncharacterized protein LOC133834120 [Humulus lupulus]|uniref:uncharacterized protein LOC133834120 n=1 Tax=Humulus lupulus TaxID=3486 RepID=UPI002B4145E9|nr:uncharacterized protein LOC133834120 [Humulus lupulus]
MYYIQYNLIHQTKVGKKRKKEKISSRSSIMVSQQIIIKIFILMYLLLLINPSFSEGSADHDHHNFKSITTGLELITNTTPNQEVMMKGRKLLIKVDAMLDYQDPGPNPSHDPRKGH